MEIVLLPRLQKETFSLYWKESMKTETVCLDSMVLRVQPSSTAAELLQQAAAALGWRPCDTIPKLEGFKGPWERLIYKGRELQLDSTLQDAGVQPGGTVVVVRVQLLAEGWKIKDMYNLSDSDEDA